MKSLLDKTTDRLVNAFLNDKIIAALPLRYTKKLSEAQKVRKMCESKIKESVIGFKAAGTAIPVIKKLKEKEPFYASIYKRNFLKSGKKVKINKSTLGIELEVCYLVKESFFSSKVSITMKNVSKYISHMAPCIEIVGYRQRKKV
jgi:2-keto-4-pentenoate hydratase